MADLSITAGNVKPASKTTRVQCVEFGLTLVAGETVYEKTTDGLWYKADCDTLAESLVTGVVLVGGAVNEIGVVAIGGTVTLGAVMTAGVTYYQSATAGKMCPRTDLTTGDYITAIITASTTSVAKIGIDKTRIAVP